jgi:hypothetical protein
MLHRVLDEIRALGVAEDTVPHAGGRRAGRQFEANAHVHLPPNFSAFASAREAVELAAGENLLCLGASNYYDFAVYGEFADEAAQWGVFPLFGLEVIALVDDLRRSGIKVNDPGNPGKMYICGKGISRFAPMSANAARIMAGIRERDRSRSARMIALVEGIFKANGVELGLDEDAIVEKVVARSGGPNETVTLQERHVALAFQEAFFERVPEDERRRRLTAILGTQSKAEATDAVAVQNEIRTHLMKSGKRAFVEEEFVTFDEAVRLVLELGGIPCYPVLLDGARPVSAFEDSPERLIENLKARGVYCAEFIPGRNEPAVLERYVKAMRRAGLPVLAGTEHNTLDRPAMTPRAAGGREIPEGVKDIFREGACVAVAHQYLNLIGKRGYVDERGRLNAEHGGVEERIGAMAGLGRAVIERFGKLQGRVQ